MSQLLDSTGQKIPGADAKLCPKCGSAKLQRYDSFGGYWQLNCLKCGHQVAKGRE